MFPLFVDLTGRRVVLVGDGPVAEAKQRQFESAGAEVRRIEPAAFAPSDLDGAWLVVAAATPDVNRRVAEAANARRVFVNAVDDPANATAFLSGVVRRDGVTLAISTEGDAPALTALVREALDQLLPRELDAWVDIARRERRAWKRDRVPMQERKPKLLEALNEFYDGIAESQDGRIAERDGGRVSLVGAGPGDPGLLTRAAIARLRAADLVLYDALVDPRILRYAKRAQRFFVGKRAGRHAVTQEAIHALMIRAARRGRRVVRLKGGDPFVFGRGGEEALALRRAGVPFDVVPGVTSATSVPASAGIPVTHRGASGAVLIVTGHDERAFGDAIRGIAPNGTTVVILMGLARSAGLACALIDAGWPRGTPAAIVVDGTTPRQHTWRGTLDDLAERRAQFDSARPGTIVVGEVVALAVELDARLKPRAPAHEAQTDGARGFSRAEEGYVGR